MVKTVQNIEKTADTKSSPEESHYNLSAGSNEGCYSIHYLKPRRLIKINKTGSSKIPFTCSRL